MKKALCLILAVLFLMSLAACSSDPVSNTNPSENNQTENRTDPTDQTNGTTESTSGQNTANTLQVPSKEIYFDCPEGWTFSKETYSTVLMETDESLIAVCYNWAVPYEGDLAGIVDFFSAGVMRDVASYSKGYLGASSITTANKSETTIAGMNAVKFTGSAPNTEWNCHVYGYTMIVDGIPMMVMGLVSTQAQDASMIAEIEALTDQVANSVRTEK